MDSLIANASVGVAAIKPIVAFGNTAVRPLVTAARLGHSNETGAVLLALAYLIEGGPKGIAPVSLSTDSIRLIHDMVRDLLRPGHIEISRLPPLTRLALLTRDPDFQRTVELLSTEPGMVAAYGAEPPDVLELIQNQIRRELATHK